MQWQLGSTGGFPLATDIDGDGWTDIVASYGSLPECSIYRGDGLGGFGPEKRHPAPLNARVVGLTEVDGNGKAGTEPAQSPPLE